jgi:putative acetyltransferase
MLVIAEDDLSTAEARALLALHLSGMRANSPAGNVFAAGVEELRRPEVTVWTARMDGAVAGVAALRRLGDGAGEIKSMRTHPEYLRKGVAAALLDHIIGAARSLGLRRLSLETGSGLAFEPALALYRTRGFINGEAFGDYRLSEFNQFLHLSL